MKNKGIRENKKVLYEIPMNRLYSVIVVFVTTSTKLVSVEAMALSTISEPSADRILSSVNVILEALTGINITLILGKDRISR